MMSAIIFIPITAIVFLFEKSIRNFFISYVYENDLVKYLNFDNKIDLETFQVNRYSKSGKNLILLVLLPLFNFNLYLLFFILALTYITYKRPYWKHKKMYEQNLALVRYQFPIWLRQIQILLHNNNVINSLINSQETAPTIIKKDLKLLINVLNESPNDINAFIQFMDYFKISEINRAMKLLYRCYLIDKNESSKQLNRMIASTTKWIRQERLQRQKDNLSYFEWIGIIPLFGVTIIFLVIMANLIINLFGKGVGM